MRSADLRFSCSPVSERPTVIRCGHGQPEEPMTTTTNEPQVPAWLNLDAVWAAALIVAGILTLLT